MEYLKNNGQGAVMGEFGGGVGGFTSFTNPEHNFSGVAIEDLPEESAPSEKSQSSHSQAMNGSSAQRKAQTNGKTKSNGAQAPAPQAAPPVVKKKKGNAIMKVGVAALVGLILYKLFVEKGK